MRTANLSERSRAYIDSLDAAPEELFLHFLATLHCPVCDDDGGVRMCWPHFSLPDDPSHFTQSTDLGGSLAMLLDTESDVTNLLTHHNHIAVTITADGHPMQPADFNWIAGQGPSEATRPLCSTGPSRPPQRHGRLLAQ
ncbi:MAG: hypothetical protein F4Y35_03725 [Chloroflexi bacterium]|nr:hypothetical protein [Chloroflexota bacterium]